MERSAGRTRLLEVEMIMWRGWGIVGLLPLIISCLIFQFAADLGIQHRGDGPLTGTVLSLFAVGIWWLGRKLNQESKGVREADHSMFRIPLEFYAVPLFAAGAFLAVASLLAPP